MRNGRKSALFITTAGLGLIWACGALATPFNVPAQPANTGIPAFATQAKIQIIAPVSQLNGINTQAVSGDFDTDTGLQKLLAGTNLKIASEQNGVIALRVADAAPAGAFPASAAPQASAEPQVVVITGSRTISNSTKSPTPLTTITSEKLLANTPASIADGLNKLPVFQGSTQPRSAGTANAMAGMNVLNLRNFGANRTLVLLDGHRVVPANADGTVSIDTLPLDLMKRVDVVTGGASAVYGSDAISGVVNFVLDDRFKGLKLDVNGGTSTYGDGASYTVRLAAGTDLFDGRGHIEFAGSTRHQSLVAMADRGVGSMTYAQTGAGTTANPFVMTPDVTRPTAPFGGRITCTSCTINGYQFLNGSAVEPFNLGATTGTNNVSSGGDGGYMKYGTALSELGVSNLFGRFSYDLAPNTTFYAEGTISEQTARGWWFPVKIGPGATGTLFKNNPYLSSAVRTALGDNGLSDSSNTFSIGEFVDTGSASDNSGTYGVNKLSSFTTGLNGDLGRFKWDLFYTHGQNTQTLYSARNQNNQKLFASLDAVALPNGTIACYAATQAATAAAYSGCVPINPFGAGSVTKAALDWFTSTTSYTMTNMLDDMGGSVSGTLFNGWAGPIRGALSAEMRYNKLTVDSSNNPNSVVDCTGLRICNAGNLLWAGGVLPMSAKDNVWEVSGEVNVPLLENMPFANSVELNLADRYTDYSTSGSVQTWKVGLNYRVNDWLRFRGTMSRDIRAPNLFELYQPATIGFGGFNDLHVVINGVAGLQGNTTQHSQGNPNLVPEVADTKTLGVVLTPFRRLSFSLDYYQIVIKNAITAINGQLPTTQQLCEASGGTSIYCSLYVRPLPFSNTTAANYATDIYSETLNSAMQQIRGYDAEADYNFDWKGNWDARVIANFQPINRQQAFPGAAYTIPGSSPAGMQLAKTHVTALLTYQAGTWTVGLEDRWHGDINPVSTINSSTQVYAYKVRAKNYTDINIQKAFTVGGLSYTGYLSVQNMFNVQGDPYNVVATQGIYYSVSPDDDVMGRYFTLGLKVKM